MTFNHEILSDALNQINFNGTISIWQQQKNIFQRCRGHRDFINQLPVNIDTRFAVASGTKTFTAIAIMLLVEKEKLSLDDHAFDYIPGNYPLYDKSITIKHLLTHTSGLPDYLDEEAESNDIDCAMYELVKPMDYLKIMPQKPMKFTPGERFKYNNSGYIFLSVIIEQVTGDFHRFIEEHILRKAQMDDSGFFRMDDLPMNTAIGYIDASKKSYRTNIFSLPIIGGGDGGMFVSVPDVHRFWNAFMNGEIISQSSINQMISPLVKTNQLFYGLGFWLKPLKDKWIPMMIGQDIGVSFESGYDREEDLSYVIVSNFEKDVWPISKTLNQMMSKEI
jgi:CubicO group peptidase (beta-lactamase class C family)